MSAFCALAVLAADKKAHRPAIERAIGFIQRKSISRIDPKDPKVGPKSWQTASNANYQMVDGSQPEHNFRGKYRSGADGRYDFETVCPVSYPIPTVGSVGKLLEAIDRPEIRPAHVHFKVSADGYEPLTTMIFTKGDPHLRKDPVFGVRESLIIDVAKHETDEGNRKAPFYTAEFDFVMEPAA